MFYDGKISATAFVQTCSIPQVQKGIAEGMAQLNALSAAMNAELITFRQRNANQLHPDRLKEGEAAIIAKHREAAQKSINNLRGIYEGARGYFKPYFGDFPNFLTQHLMIEGASLADDLAARNLEANRLAGIAVGQLLDEATSAAHGKRQAQLGLIFLEIQKRGVEIPCEIFEAAKGCGHEVYTTGKKITESALALDAYCDKALDHLFPPKAPETKAEHDAALNRKLSFGHALEAVIGTRNEREPFPHKPVRGTSYSEEGRA